MTEEVAVAEEAAAEAKAPSLAGFYIGAVELFAVLVPGAILTFLLIPWLPLEDLPQTGRISFTPTVQWVAFAIAAYAVGHLLFSMGAVVMDPLYDLFFKNRSASFQKRRRMIYHELETRPEFKDTLRFQSGSGDNALDWTLAILSFRAPGSFARLDHLEADSKFLRSLVLVLLFSSPLLQDRKTTSTGILIAAFAVIAACLVGLIVMSELTKRSEVDKRTKEQEQKEQDAKEREEREAKEHKLRLGISFLFVALCVLLLGAVLDYFGYRLFLVYWLSSFAVAMLAAFRYMEIRQKRTRLAYELLLVSVAEADRQESRTRRVAP
jgi:hypothetical protein